MSDLDPSEQKEIFKQAIREWMDERYAEVGRWTIRVLITTALTALLWVYIKSGGFKWP